MPTYSTALENRTAVCGGKRVLNGMGCKVGSNLIGPMGTGVARSGTCGSAASTLTAPALLTGVEESHIS